MLRGSQGQGSKDPRKSEDRRERANGKQGTTGNDEARPTHGPESEAQARSVSRGAEGRNGVQGDRTARRGGKEAAQKLGTRVNQPRSNGHNRGAQRGR